MHGPVTVDLVEVATGVTVSRYAVDARELLASGSYVLASAEADAPVAAPSAGGEGDGDGSPSSAAESATDAKPTRKGKG